MPFTNVGGPHPSSPPSWKDTFFNMYLWCKTLSICLNIMYMIKTLEWVYSAAANIAAHQEFDEMYTTPVQYGLQVFIGCLMMFCLVIDIVVLTTSKLNVANWFWRPGMFFFTLTCGVEIIAISDMLFGNDFYHQNCLQKLSGSDTSVTVVQELCNLQSRLDHILLVGILFRDTLICGAYVAASYFHMLALVQTLKSRSSPDTALQIMSSSYQV